ncbi:MAG TPA: hypothetical protein VGP24_11810, partial [Glaciihabitans sp.]|nr:hypothetical protein [Glaciihabitans sp.]
MATKTWVNSSGFNAWDDGGGWSPEDAPLTGDDVIIPDAVTPPASGPAGSIFLNSLTALHSSGTCSLANVEVTGSVNIGGAVTFDGHFGAACTGLFGDSSTNAGAEYLLSATFSDTSTNAGFVTNGIFTNDAVNAGAVVNLTLESVSVNLVAGTATNIIIAGTPD